MSFRIQEKIQPADPGFTQSLINSIEPLLEALNWPGTRHHLLEAVPYMSGIHTVQDVISIMKTLYYQVTVLEISTSNMNKDIVPCLFITKENEVYVVLSNKEGFLEVYDGQTNERKRIPDPSLLGTAYIFKYVSERTSLAQRNKLPWVWSTIKPYYPVYIYGFIAALVLSVFYLAVPLFARAVYNQVIPTESGFVLTGFLFAVIVILIGSAVLQWLQAKLLILTGAKISNELNDDIFKRLLYLAPAYTENATVNAQVARMKDFDNVRDFLTGPIFRLVFEFTFIVVGFIIIWILGGTLIYIPIVAILLYALLFLSFRDMVNKDIDASAVAGNARQDFLLESLYSLRTLKLSHAENTWNQRFRYISADASVKNFYASQLMASINVALDIIMTGTGFAVIAFGAVSVMDHTLTVGTLIAIMMITWRMLYPLKGIFGSQVRIAQFFSSIRQINNFMNILPERDPAILIDKMKNLKGKITFSRVSFRYPGTPDFALMGLNFEAKVGDVIGIAGRIGSGKSTILKLIMSLYQPVAGNIFIDDIDIRQIDPARLRYSIGYVSQTNTIFFGTVSQNILLANPTATENELFHSVQRADILDDILAMPQAYQTRLDDQSNLHLSPGFIQRLALARTYLKKPPIILLDEPVTTLDEKGEKAFLNAIEYFRGHATIFIVTHRPSLLKISDKLLVMSRGQLMMSGPTAEVLSKLPKDLI